MRTIFVTLKKTLVLPALAATIFTAFLADNVRLKLQADSKK